MKQTVTSKYEPKSKNVTWIDMSSGSPILKNFINGMWRPTGGSGEGGEGSSNPTEADVTKVWQVTPVLKETKTEEFVIVPEQTLVGGTVELEYNDKFVPGAQCVAVINGVEDRDVVFEGKGGYVFQGESYYFVYNPDEELFQFYNNLDSLEVTAKLSVIEEVPDYDYNWAPGVKIPIPTAEDEGKILVVTETEGNIYTIVPEQPAPEDNKTPLTNVDLTKFVVGNTVKVTITYEEQANTGVGMPEEEAPDEVPEANPQTITETGVIEERERITGVVFSTFQVWQIDNLLYTNAVDAFSPNSTIKLEYIEQNYEYQLQENSGAGSNILYCEGSDDSHGLITAYIDSSELANPQITTIAVNTGETTVYFYRMGGNNWLVSGFNTFSDKNEWIKAWNTEGQYPTIYASFYQK